MNFSKDFPELGASGEQKSSPKNDWLPKIPRKAYFNLLTESFQCLMCNKEEDRQVLSSDSKTDYI